jgi:hypothetical protein
MIYCDVCFPDGTVFPVVYPTVPRIGESLSFVHTDKNEGIWKVHEVQWISAARVIEGTRQLRFERVKVKVA